MSGKATVFAENAGVIGLIAWILIWISAYTAYLSWPVRTSGSGHQA
jgi:hypothetical protein